MTTSAPTKNDRECVTLTVTGLGHIPSIKNSFHAIVDPKNRDWKARCVKLFASQLLSSIATNESETVTPQSVRSLIASLPPDDRWRDIPEHQVKCIKVPKGEEGAEITITEIL